MFLRRMALLLSAGTLAISLSAAATGTANATVPTDPNFNEIVSWWTHSGNTMCIDDPSHSASLNTKLQLWHCHGYASDGAPQRWFFEPTFLEDGTPAYVIYLANTLSVGGDDPGQFLCIHYWNEDRWANQPMALGNCYPREIDWVMDPGLGGGNNIMLRDPETGLCLSAANFSDSNGTPLIAAACNPYDPTQVFWLG